MSESSKQALLLIAITVCLVLVLNPSALNAVSAMGRRQTELPRRVLSAAEMQQFTTTANTGEIVMVGANGVLIDQGTQAVRVGTADVSIITAGQERLKISNSGVTSFNGNVGIGTTDPQATLDVTGGTIRSQILQTFVNGGGVSNTNLMGTLGFVDSSGISSDGYGALITCNGSYGGAGDNYGGTLRFSTYSHPSGNKEAMRINNYGNVGIGTNTLNGNLHIRAAPGAGETQCILTLENSHPLYQRGQIQIRAIHEGPFGYGNAMAFYTRQDSGSNFTPTDLITERMRINSVGNVGIGTNNPSSLLQIGSAVDAIYANNPISYNTVSIFGAARTPPSYSGTGDLGGTLFVNSTSSYGRNVGASIALGGRSNNWGGGELHMTFARISGVQHTSSDTYLGELVFETQDTGNMYERMRIKSNGTVGIGTTNPGSEKLFIVTGYNENSIGCKAGTDNNYIIVFYNTSGSIRGTIQGNGANAVSYNTSSDRRLKHNVQYLGNGLSIIQQLRPVQFEWKEDGLNDYGFLAQDVYKVLPHLRPNFSSYIKSCSCTPIGLNRGVLCDHCLSMNDEPMDDDGKPRHYALDYGKFTPYLVAAVQEQHQQIAQQHQQIQDLQTRLSRLESLLSR
jgi:hypothetical protein